MAMVTKGIGTASELTRRSWLRAVVAAGTVPFVGAWGGMRGGDMEIQRKVDMATVQQNIGQIQGTTGAELLKQRELYNMLMNNASLRGGAR